MSESMDRRISRPWWRRKPAMIGGAVLALVLLGGAAAGAFVNGMKPSLRAPMHTVTISPVTAGLFQDFTLLRAKVAPKDVIFLDALEGGQVEEVMARSGDVVAAGQPMVRFRNTELELQVLDRQGALVQSITQLQSYAKTLEDTRLANEREAAKIDYDTLRLTTEFNREEALMKRGFGTPALRDRALNELDYVRKLKPLQADGAGRQEELRRKRAPEIEAEIAGLRQSLEITRAKLANLVVRAPVAGRLADMDLNIGEIRTRGQRLGQIVPDTGFKLTATVDEYYLARVRPAQVARITAGDKAYPARVMRVDPQVKDAAFTVELEFTGALPPGLLPGQALEGRLALGGDEQAVMLAAGPFLEISGGDWVMVMDDGGRFAEKRRVRLGRRNSDTIEVVSGLKPGERVITSDYTAFQKVERVDLSK